MANEIDIEALVEDAANNGFLMAMKVAARVAARMADSDMAKGVSATDVLKIYAKIIEDVNRQNFKEKLGFK